MSAWNDPTHPIWGIARVVVVFTLIMAAAYWLSKGHASNFDETEHAMLRELAGVVIVVVGGIEGLQRWLKR